MRGPFVNSQMSGPEAEQHPEYYRGQNQPNDAMPIDLLPAIADEYAQAENRQHEVEIDNPSSGNQDDQDRGHNSGEPVFP